MIEIVEFGMDNRTSVLVADLTRLVVNAEFPALGRTALRRGLTTYDSADMQVGAAAPFRLFRWFVGGTSYLIAVGSDAEGFVNPLNNYLYARDAAGLAGGRIYSDAEAVPTEVAALWGLAMPTAPVTTDFAAATRASTQARPSAFPWVKRSSGACSTCSASPSMSVAPSTRPSARRSTVSRRR